MRNLKNESLMSTLAIFGPEKMVEEMIKAGASNDDLAQVCALQVTYGIAKAVQHKFYEVFDYSPSRMEPEGYLGAYMAHLMKGLFSHSVMVAVDSEKIEGKEEA